MEQVFKAYDVRGLVGSELTEDLYYKIGVAFGNWLSDEGEIAIGWDMRPSSAGFAKALSDGLRSTGRDVVHLGMITTDMLYFAVGHYKFAGGAVITASHNPSQYNGLKLCYSEARPIGLDSGLSDIRDQALAMNNQRTKPIAKLRELNCLEGWIDHVLSFSDNNFKFFKIAVDAGNGMAGTTFPALAKRLPFEITELYFEPDGTFPNHEANPLNYDTLKDIQKVIIDNNLDFGIAFDGDGDRAFLIDDKGVVLSGSETTAIVAQYMLEQNPGAKITYDLRISKTTPEIITENGGVAIRTKVGHAFIKQIMREQNALFGGEQSGHYYFKDNWFADSGLIATVIAITILSKTNEKLSEFRKKYLRYKVIPETNYQTSKSREQVFDEIKGAFVGAELDHLDGITVAYPDRWFNVRASNTEPVMRLNMEAETQDQIDEMMNKIEKILA